MPFFTRPLEVNSGYSFFGFGKYGTPDLLETSRLVKYLQLEQMIGNLSARPEAS